MTAQDQGLEGLYRELFDTIDQGFCVVEVLLDEAGRPVDYRFLEVNTAFEGQTGLSEVVGRCARAVIPDLEDSWVEIYGRVALSGEPARFVNHAAGLENRWFEVTAFPIGPPGEHQVAILFQDITVRRRIEKELEEARSRLASTLAAAEIGTWEFDVAQDRVRADRNLSRMFGLLPTDGTDQPLATYVESIHPDDRECVRRILGQALEACEDFEATYRVQVPGEAPRHVLARGRVECDDAGRPVRLPGVVIDVTEQKRAQEQLRLALDATGLGTWQLDPETLDLATDARFREIFGVSAERLGYDEAVGLIHADDRRRVEDAVAAAIRPQDPEPYAVEYRVVHSDGSVRWVFATGQASFHTDRQLAGFNGTVEDITTRKETEERIREQSHELAATSRRKDEFLAMLSHELRNPLAPVFNALELIENGGEISRPQRMALGIIERQMHHLARLVDDLLEVSRITTGRIHLQPEPISTRELVDRTLERVGPVIAQRSQDLTVEVEDPGLTLWADPTRLEQAVGNLLHNASKYSEVGGAILLRVETDGDCAVIRVRDEGMGIAPDLLPHIFDLFTQADQSLDRSEGGLGIGLALVQRLAQLHGGTVEAHSDGAGRGSEFLLRLPLSTSPPGPAEPVDHLAEDCVPEAPQALRVLVVDDHVDAARSSQMLLEAWGHDARVAADGPAALAELEDFRPDVVLLDIGLPDMDGYEVARRIRAGDAAPTTRLIAVTGYGQDADRLRSKQVGFDDHWVKPIRPARLRELLLEMGEGARREDART
jgi:PAS domain S-box-containing protein